MSEYVIYLQSDDPRAIFDAISAKLETGLQKLFIDVSRQVDRALIRGTPVDTGEARSNWFLSLGTPIEVTIKPYVPYPKYSGPKIDEEANALAAESQANAILQGFQKTDLDKPIFITNSVSYIQLLNAGSSNQAPANFVELAVMIGAETAVIHSILD